MVRFARCPAALMAALVLALVGCNGRTDAAQGGLSSEASSSASDVSAAGTASSSSAPGVSAADTPLYEEFTAQAKPPPAKAEPPVSAAEKNAPGYYLAPLSAAWAKSGQTLYVTTYGSGSCPSVVESQIKVVSTKPQRLILRTSNPDNPRGTAP